MSHITIFTDGSSRGNPGPGGWGALLIKREEESDNSKEASRVIEIGGREENTTNNRMELKAILEGLLFIESRKYKGIVVFYTDSSYACNGITKWIFSWQKNNWKTGEGKDVLNKDLWEEIYKSIFRLKLSFKIEWRKIDGHSGFFGNERADEIATSFADQNIPLLFSGSILEYERLFNINLSQITDTNKVNIKKSSSKNKKPYSYVSSINREVQTHESWDSCKKRVHGKAGTKFKKVFSKEEESALIKLWQLE